VLQISFLEAGHRVFSLHLPDSAGGGVDHGLVGFATEGFLKLGHVGDYAVDARETWRVGIGNCAYAQVLRAFVFTCPLRHAYEESLVWREAVG